MSIGYACLTIGTENTGLTKCKLSSATPQKLRELIASNLTALEAMLDYNIRNRIKLFRISSDLIPFGSHPLNQISWWEEYDPTLRNIGKKIKDHGIRVSMHPGQYTVLNSPDIGVVDKAIKELVYHARILDALQTEESSKLVLHIGGSYGNKKEAMERFIKEFWQLPGEVRRRLILENDEKNYNIQEVLTISEYTGSPVVFDNLHHSLNMPREKKEEQEWIRNCQSTWKEKDGPQKIHYSQQKAGAHPGSHSDTILSGAFLEFYGRLPNPKPDIMLEVKDKNLSALKCIHLTERAKAVQLEAEWARYKYLVLSRSARAYQSIRELLKDKSAEAAMEFYQLVETALSLPQDTGAEVNAAQHVWGYISRAIIENPVAGSLAFNSPMTDNMIPGSIAPEKKFTGSFASENREKERFERFLNSFRSGQQSIAPLKKFLYRCAKERELTYLLESLYFYL